MLSYKISGYIIGEIEVRIAEYIIAVDMTCSIIEPVFVNMVDDIISKPIWSIANIYTTISKYPIIPPE